MAGPVSVGPSLQTPALRVARLTAAGVVASAADVSIPFGDGLASVFAVRREPTVMSLSQSDFFPGRALVRGDGSVVLPGAVGVVQYTGEGAGYEVDRAGVAAVTPDFVLDPSFGGPARPATIAVRVARQRASTATNVRAAARRGRRAHLESRPVPAACEGRRSRDRALHRSGLLHRPAATAGAADHRGAPLPAPRPPRARHGHGQPPRPRRHRGPSARDGDTAVAAEATRPPPTAARWPPVCPRPVSRPGSARQTVRSRARHPRSHLQTGLQQRPPGARRGVLVDRASARIDRRPLSAHPRAPRALDRDRRLSAQARLPVPAPAHPRRGPCLGQAPLTTKKMRRLELTAGAPRHQGGHGIWSTNDAMRHAERELASKPNAPTNAPSRTPTSGRERDTEPRIKWLLQGAGRAADPKPQVCGLTRRHSPHPTLPRPAVTHQAHLTFIRRPRQE